MSRWAALLAALTLVVGSCGSSDYNNFLGKHNQADVTFAQDMIPHHTQAIVMSTMAKNHAKDRKLRQLAADIRNAQQPEIEQMSEWLNAWGETVPAAGRDPDDMGSMMDDGHMSGMMTGGQMMDLDRARGSRFDGMWLTMMIEHHEGAIDMAEVEQRRGSSIDAIELARSIASTQTAEIALMKSMLRN
jgi:uncharacterized protein (DUF305 family)